MTDRPTPSAITYGDLWTLADSERRRHESWDSVCQQRAAEAVSDFDAREVYGRMDGEHARAALRYLTLQKLTFTTDPYFPGDNSLTRDVLIALRDHGLGFCTLSKGGARALRDIDLFRPDRDAYAATLTSLDERFSHKWERGAALPADRLVTLKTFHARGIFTWVSLEPTLNVDASMAIVEATHGFVDLYKIGRANYLPMTKTTDWQSYTMRMLDVLNRLGARHYIKQDLQAFLPAGYPNPMRWLGRRIDLVRRL